MGNLSSIKEILAADEKVLFKSEAKAKKILYVEFALWLLTTFLIVFVDFFLISVTAVSEVIKKAETSSVVILILALVVHVVPCVMWVYYFATKVIKNTEVKYYFTNSRLIIMSGEEYSFVTIIKYSSLTGINAVKNKLVLVMGRKTLTVKNLADPSKVCEAIKAITESEENAIVEE